MKTVQVQGQAALVEYETFGQIKRVTVPVHLAKNPGVVQAGIPYGLPWEEIVGELITPGEMVAAQLRRAGIWTYDDLLKKPREALAAIMAAYKFDLQILAARAREYEEQQRR